jgi:hypothetical protein
VPAVPNPAPPTVEEPDELSHAPGPETWWNESWYADVADLAGGYGAWLRFGLYPNRSQTWFHLVVARPGQPVVICEDLQAPLATGDRQGMSTDRWSCQLDAIAPLREWRARASARAAAFAEPAALYRGEAGEPTAVELDLTWSTQGEPYHYGVSPRYEVPAHVTGSITVGSEVLAVDAPGQRDHSWAVRDWWAFSWCWSAGALDDGTRFHLSDIRLPRGSIGFGYRLDPDGLRTLATEVSAGEEPGPEGFPVRGELAVEPGGPAVTVEPIAFSPLLFTADDGRVSRFPRALCRYRTSDGRTGTGWTEWNQPQPEDGP